MKLRIGFIAAIALACPLPPFGEESPRPEPKHGGGFGPAYPCGIRMDQKLKEPFLIIKTSPGGISLMVHVVRGGCEMISAHPTSGRFLEEVDAGNSVHSRS